MHTKATLNNDTILRIHIYKYKSLPSTCIQVGIHSFIPSNLSIPSIKTYLTCMHTLPYVLRKYRIAP